MHVISGPSGEEQTLRVSIPAPADDRTVDMSIGDDRTVDMSIPSAGDRTVSLSVRAPVGDETTALFAPAPKPSAPAASPTRHIPVPRNPTPPSRAVSQDRAVPQDRPVSRGRVVSQGRVESQGRPAEHSGPVVQGRPLAQREPVARARVGGQDRPVSQERPMSQERPVAPRAAVPQRGSARVLRPYQPRSYEMPTRALPQVPHAQPVFVDDSGRRGRLLAWASIIVAVGALLLLGAFWLSQATSPDVGGPPVACALRCNASVGD